MSKLYQARENTLTKPLNKDELGYLYNGKYISLIMDDIKKRKYGSYLVGGVVGTGKSSQVEIASNLAMENALIIHIKFDSEEECLNGFERRLLIELLKTIEERELEKEFKLLSNIVGICNENLNYKIENIDINEEISEIEEKTSVSEKVSMLAKIGAAISNIIQSEIYALTEEKEEKSQTKDKAEKHMQTVTRTKIQKTLLEYIYQILDILSDKNIIVIYDELDKMDEDILKVLFAKYKTLFVEKDIFSFFVVNDTIYRKYSDLNLIINPTYSYFMERYYIPLLSFEETLRYSKMMFGEELYLRGLVTYYLCLGNYRMINQRYLSAYSDKDIDVVKAYVLKKVLEKTCLPYYDDYMRDVLVGKIKAAIERIIIVRKFKVVELATEMTKGSKSVETWPDYNVIIEYIIEVIESMCSKAIEMTNEMTVVKCEELNENYYSIEELIENDRDVALSEEEQKMIHLSDMYRKNYEYYSHKNKEVGYLHEDLKLLKVADNEHMSYKEALINIMYTNLMEKGIQVIAIRRARGEESYCSNDYEYTGMVIVDRGNYQIAYYVNKGSYETDKKEAIDGLIKEAKKLNINVKKLVALKPIDIEKDIECVRGRYNNPFSECYEHRNVKYENWT